MAIGEMTQRLGLLECFGELDLWFAELVADLDKEGGRDLFLAAALACRATRNGHVCLDIEGQAAGFGELFGLELPEPKEWIKSLSQSPAVGVPGDYKPLVIDGAGRLYLHRYWNFQERIADFLRSRAQVSATFDKDLLKDGLSRLFPRKGDTGVLDMQKVAAVSAATRGFCIISGGPGTGKTYTAARILFLLAQQAASRGGSINILLAAPTGKAAARLGDAVSAARRDLKAGDDLLSMVPQSASTIHRLIGAGRQGRGPYYNRGNRLEADVVLVDEASMVDVGLMAQLVDAIPEGCRLILVGDKDQLAPVEAGSVFADICGAAGDGFSQEFADLLSDLGVLPEGVRDSIGKSGSILADSVIYLKEQYRFASGNKTAVASRLVREGRAKEAADFLTSEGVLRDEAAYDEGGGGWQRAVVDRIAKWVSDYMSAAGDLEAVFDRLDRFRVLCALRDGPYGAESVNGLAERLLGREGVLDTGRAWYAGRPVMILKNDYQLGLFNGDVGIALHDPRGKLLVFFRDPGGGFRSFHPGRLPEHQTVYAMTVHKSQGSEFDRVLLVMPDRDSPVLTRELVYTAITRAKKVVEIIGGRDILELAVSRPVARVSGLADAMEQGNKTRG